MPAKKPAAETQRKVTTATQSDRTSQKMTKTPASETPAKTASKAAAAAKPAKKKAAEPGSPASAAPSSTTPPTTGVVATYVQRNPRPIVVESDDGDEDSNLLTGPRNVQPYIAKRGEQYMSREQLDHFRTILEIWKRDLMVEVDRTVSHMKDEAANFPDPNDRATQEEEFSLELRTRDRERKLIRKIEEALARIEDGSYGYCLETGEEIGIKRLEARPVATLSLEAQERRERREKQYGDRDDRYR
jgi:DnaK suppressor protein